MARSRYNNLSGEGTPELLREGDNVSVSKISMANLHASNAVTVDLFIQKQNLGKFYLIKNVSIPALTSLIYDTTIDTKDGGFSLFINLTKSASETPIVDVIAF